MQRKTEEVSSTWSQTAKTWRKDFILSFSLSRYIDNLVWISPHRFLTSIYRLDLICKAYDCQESSSQNNSLQLSYLDNQKLTVFYKKQWLLHIVSLRTWLYHHTQVWYSQTSLAPKLQSVHRQTCSIRGMMAVLKSEFPGTRHFWIQNYLEVLITWSRYKAPPIKQWEVSYDKGFVF